MNDELHDDNRRRLIEGLTELAALIEANPPPIIGSDIHVQSGLGGRATGSSISVAAGPGSGGGVGQRISVVAQGGQPVIGQRITVVAGVGGPAARPEAGAASQDEIRDAVAQLRDAAGALASSPASESWIRGVLKTVGGWGSSALSGAVSGATNAMVRFYMTGT